MWRDYKVILGLRWGEVSGVDVFSAHLGQAFVEKGVPAQILLSHSASAFQLPLAKDLPVHRLDVNPSDSWGTRWRKMIRYLESEAPCVYVPNYDYNYSCVSPRLSDRIIILGIIHSDDPVHYEHVARLGRYWNGIAAVSQVIADKAIATDRTLSGRIAIIPYGIPFPSSLNRKSEDSNRPLRIIYVGRLIEYQKRISELPKIFFKLYEQQVPFEATIIGDGPERHSFLDACGPLIEQGLVRWLGIRSNQEVQELLEKQDVIVLTSEFEGLPLCVLEAMARGCIPVCMKIQSGLPELIHDGENGFIVPQGDISGFAERLAILQSDSHQRQILSQNASSIIREKYEIGTMFDSYVELIERMIHDAETGVYRRPSGKILPPPSIKITWKDHLPIGIRMAGRRGRRYLRRTFWGTSKHEKVQHL